LVSSSEFALRFSVRWILLPPQASFVSTRFNRFWDPSQFAPLALTIAIAVPGTLRAQDAKSKLKSPITDPTQPILCHSIRDGRQTQATPDKTMVEAAQQALGEAATRF